MMLVRGMTADHHRSAEKRKNYDGNSPRGRSRGNSSCENTTSYYTRAGSFAGVE